MMTNNISQAQCLSVLELAKQAGFEIVDDMIDLGEHSDFSATEALKAFANLIDARARADEREQCAKICDKWAGYDSIHPAIDIRERGK